MFSLYLSFLYFRFLIVESAINSASAFLVSSICFSLWRRFDDFDPCWEYNFWNFSASCIFKLFNLEWTITRVASNTDFGGAFLYRATLSMASFYFFSYSFSASLRLPWSSLTLAFTFCLSNVSFVTSSKVISMSSASSLIRFQRTAVLSERSTNVFWLRRRQPAFFFFVFFVMTCLKRV